MTACAEAEEPRYKPAKQRRDLLGRQLRVDMEGVDDTTARLLLLNFRRTIDRQVQAYMPAAGSTFHAIERDDLVSIAECAVLEAYVTYQNRETPTELSTWVLRTIGWRLGETMQQLLTFEPPAHVRCDPHEQDRIEDAEQENAVQARELVDWLRRRLPCLTPRQQVIIIEVLGGRTKTDVAAAHGISPGRVSQEWAAAVKHLRELAALDGIDYLGLGA